MPIQLVPRSDMAVEVVLVFVVDVILEEVVELEVVSLANPLIVAIVIIM
jgi:hypothetical protein